MQVHGVKGLPYWWGPKDDKALLKGYHSMGGLPWNSRLMLAIADAMLVDSNLDFSVKVYHASDFVLSELPLELSYVPHVLI